VSEVEKAMKPSVLRSLTERDTVLILETKRKNLDELSEDQLVALHSRVQRARTRHVTNYRRAGAAAVPETGTRSLARSGNQLNRDRAEAFETALARVSKRLAAVAKQSADSLRKERLSAAKAGKGTPEIAASAGDGATAAPEDKVSDRRVRTPAKKKEVASNAAAGKRRQARKDSRGK
jgi:hypothetical protein